MKSLSSFKSILLAAVFLVLGSFSPFDKTTLRISGIAAAFDASDYKDHYFGCSNALRDMRKSKNQIKFAAFAKRRALSITGMRGCGYAWGQPSQRKADEIAMRNCRKHETKQGQCVLVRL